MKHSPLPTVLSALVFALLCLSTAAAQAANWKYRDAQGRIVVSDLPPPAGVQDKDILERPTVVVRRAAAPTAAASAAATAAPTTVAQGSDPELEARRKKAASEQEQKQKVEQEKDAAQRAENCSRAKSHLAALGDGLRIARTNDKGEREILDDKGRAEEMQRSRQVIASDCK
jgi:mRNA-degrading endonuclease toxin of MazEF toxin-antitoxin module